MDLGSTASLIDGYFLAVSALKDDGTHFRCIELRDADITTASSEAARAFGLADKEFTMVPAAMAKTNLPESLQHWIVNRIRPMNRADEEPLDNRLVHGLCEEIGNLRRSSAVVRASSLRTP